MSPRFRHFALCLTTNCLGALLLASINYALTPLSLYLVLSGLYIPFPALTLSFRTGLLCVVFTGLWLDAMLPVPFGVSATFFALSSTLLFYIRSFLRWEHNFHLVPLALILNGLYILYLSFFTSGDPYGLGMASAYWVRITTDLLASSLAIVLIGGWFFNFQRALLLVAGVDLAAELRESS